jgi:hypothetical protein
MAREPWPTAKSMLTAKTCPDSHYSPAPRRCPRLDVCSLERVTRIELALSAWEVQRLGLLGPLTSQVGWPLVAVTAPSSPWLMAR